MTETTPSPLGNVITIDDERIKNHLDRVVRGSVEETLNALLDAEADRLCNAQRYERSEARRDTRAGHYERKLQTKAGEVKLRIPKLRPADLRDGDHRALPAARELGRGGLDRDVSGGGLGTPGRGHHRGAVGHAGVALDGVGSEQEDLRDDRGLAQPADRGRASLRYLDGIVLKRSWAGEVRNVSLLVAIAVNGEGYREILGICEGAKEDKAGWSGFLKHLKARGLKGVRLIISDACIGLSESAAEFFPEAAWQRCIVHFYRNIFSHVPSTKVREIAAMLKAIHAGEDIVAARQKAVQVIEKLRGLRLTRAAELVAAAAEETLDLLRFPRGALGVSAPRMRLTSCFFELGEATGPFFCSAAPQIILPSRPSISEPPRAEVVKAGRICGDRKARP